MRCGWEEEQLELEIRMVEIDLVNALRVYLRRRIRFALGRFSPSVRRVTVRVAGGAPEDVGTEVQITVALVSGGRIVLRERAADLHAAIDAAVNRLGRTITRRMERIYPTSPEHARPRSSA